MKFVWLLLSILLIGCYNKPNVEYGTELAQKQDQLIHRYISDDPIQQHEIKSLENNAWFIMADSIAPSNLVVRQYCLIDVLNKSPNNVNKILTLMYKLSYGGQIWAEGYSYWQYTLRGLELWLSELANVMKTSDLLIFVNLVNGIEEGFIKTAYIRNDVWYPAPFGDVRDEPLSVRFQNKCSNINFVQHSIITMKVDSNKVHYTIKGKAIGLNTHVPNDTFYVEVINGIPNYKFYEGYDKKYKNNIEEIKDMIDRIGK